MANKTMTYSLKVFFRNLFILVFFINISGCMGRLPVLPESENKDQLMLANANDAFKNKSFFKAEELFTKLYTGAFSHDIRRIALYGLACTRLVLAENEDDFNHAFDLWHSWYNIPSGNISGEDPRMMEPVFEKIISRQWPLDNFSEKTLTNEASDIMINSTYSDHPAINALESPSIKEFGYDKPMSTQDQAPVSNIEPSSPSSEIQYLLESREKEILKLRQQLGSMEKNIKSLKDQIHAIEEIHQEIFEKKKGMRLR